jgi:hypothetical protein
MAARSSLVHRKIAKARSLPIVSRPGRQETYRLNAGTLRLTCSNGPTVKLPGARMTSGARAINSAAYMPRLGLEKKSPGGDRGSSTSPRQGVRGGCWSRGRESGLQRGHHAQLCRAALFPGEQAHQQFSRDARGLLTTGGG